MRVNDDGRTVAAAMDVLAPGIGEIIGGIQRDERLEMLDRNMTERGIDKEHWGFRSNRPARRLGPQNCAARSAPTKGTVNGRERSGFRFRPV
jgi:aspartyl/asparaginyl-tRNA synthetase